MSESTADIVRDGLLSAHSIGKRLAWSHDRISPLFPLKSDGVSVLDNESEERLDAYLHRFNTLFSMIQDHLFKGIALLEMEDISNRSNRDKTNLMEKLGVISSATGFSTMAELRNKLSHHYPNEAEKQAERLTAAWKAGPQILSVLTDVIRYATDKKLVSGLEGLV